MRAGDAPPARRRHLPRHPLLRRAARRARPRPRGPRLRRGRTHGPGAVDRSIDVDGAGGAGQRVGGGGGAAHGTCCGPSWTSEARASAAVGRVDLSPPRGAERALTRVPLHRRRRPQVRDPTGAVVVRDLTVAVPAGGSLLVVGPSGCGKTTLVRALAELWRPSAGTLAVPARARPPGVLVLPQRPLLAPGRTLREQLLYPEAAPPSSAEEAQEEAELRALLEAVELGHLLDRVAGRWDAPWEGWGALTPGELQRLGVARLLRRRPALAVLDEATGAVDEAAEARLYGQIRRAAAAIVSVGHRESLKQQHRVVLSLAGDGSGDWSLSRLSRS